MSTEGRLSEGGGGAAIGDARDAASSVGAPGLPSSQATEQPFCRAARWTPGQLLFFAPGVGHPSWRTSSEEARNAIISSGRPVLLVDPRPSAAAEVLVDDGRTEFAASLWELVQASADEVVPLSREFAHAAASPSPRCASLPVDSTQRPSPLSWLSPAGLQAAGQATISVPGRALRHIVGRGGATIRRIEAVLGVLVGAVDCPDGTAAVSLCGPPNRLADAERVVQLIGQGHRTLLTRLEEDPGTWAGLGAAHD